MTIKKQFERLHTQRYPILQRVREAAAYTIPSILPEEEFPFGEGQSEQQRELLRPYQSLGARGVSNLASKLTMTLFPPGIAWFRFTPSPAAVYDAEISDELFAQWWAFLSERERRVSQKLDTTNYRIAQRTAIENLLVAGNSLTRLNDDYSMVAYRFDQWVQRRDGSGRAREIIVAEVPDLDSLQEEHYRAADVTPEQILAATSTQAPILLYTRCAWQPESRRWLIQQELNDVLIATSEEPVCPYFSAGYQEMPGQHYSRSFVEENIGDLRSYNGLWKALLEGGASLAQMLWVTDPTKGYRPADLAKPNLSVITGRVTAGNVDGVACLTSQKSQDFRFVLDGTAAIGQRLGRAMLLETSSQPKGERVTATQVLRIARELEGALGGVYSHIADEIQRPLLERFVYQMQRDRLLQPIPENLKHLMDVHVTTGEQAIARNMELERLWVAYSMVMQHPQAAQYINPRILAERVFRNLGVETRDGLLRSDQEIQEAEAAVVRRQIGQAAAQEAIATAGDVVRKQLEPVG